MATQATRVICGAAALLVSGWLALAPVHAQRVDARELGKDPRIWRAFRPLVLAVGQGEHGRAVRYMEQGSSILRKADANLELDPAAEKFRSSARASLRRFDLEDFYQLLPEKRGNARRFAVSGAPGSRSYKVKLARGDDFEVKADGARRGFGDSSVVVRVEPRSEQRDDRYLVQWRGGVGVGPVSWAHILEGGSDALRLLETRSDADAPVVVRAAESYLRKTQPDLGAEDRRVLSLSWASFVNVAELMTGLSRWEDVRAAAAVAGCAPVRMVSRWSPERIARNYPEAAEYLEDLDALVDLRLRLRDASGHTLLRLRADSDRLRSELRFFTHDGRIVPSKAGKPLPQRAARYERMRAHFDLHFVLHGVHLHVDDFQVDLRYREDQNGASLQASATRVPRVRVEGAAFGFVPAGMLDWFIPGDVASLAEKLFQVAVEGDGGRGVRWRGRFARPAGALATADGSASWELLDNALVRFGMAIVSARVLPDEDQAEDLERMAVDYRDAFDADLKRFAKYGADGG